MMKPVAIMKKPTILPFTCCHQCIWVDRCRQAGEPPLVVLLRVGERAALWIFFPQVIVGGKSFVFPLTG
jgi:hypothetical protein